MRTWTISIITGLAVIGSARADLLQVQTSPPAAVVQQTAANPCFYGGSNCFAPSGWTSLDAVTGSGETFTGSITYDLRIAPYSNVFATPFLIGVDVNDDNKAQILNSLMVDFNTGQHYEVSPIPQNLPNTANGVGYSDFIIELQGGGPIPVPTGAISVTFSLDLKNLSDGPDRLFVIPQSAPVPDGGVTIMLLGGALLGLETLRRRFSA